MTRSSVVLPQPEGPMKETNSPASIARSTSDSACTGPSAVSNTRDRPWISTTRAAGSFDEVMAAFRSTAPFAPIRDGSQDSTRWSNLERFQIDGMLADVGLQPRGRRMSQEQPHSPDIAAHRLSESAYEANFADLHPPLDPHEARVAADRCLFCWEAPCVAACPTGIDIPLFIRQISTGNALAAAKTILDANIMGGMCARVCPTETLCEQACVREAAEGAPVRIGLLQRHATDALLASGRKPYRQGAPTGRRVAVVGAGPAGLACAHKLATLGHAVTLFEARPSRPGSTNTASPPTRRRTISPRAKPPSSSMSAASR